MPLDASEVVRRLAYVRYLHVLGDDQARLPDPLVSAALLHYHDAVESFLLMAGEHLGAPSVYEFEKYWDKLKPTTLPGGVDLSVEQGMKRLNLQRRALKHHGSHPNAATIDLIRSDTATFLAAATQLVFNVDYGAVSMANVIPQSAVRDLVLRSEVANSSGDHVEAMIALIEAFDELIRPRSRTVAPDDASPLRFGPGMGRVPSEDSIARYLYSQEGSRAHPRLNDELARVISTLTQVVRPLQEAAQLTAIGIDYVAYQRFKALTPSRDKFMDGHEEYHAPRAYAPDDRDVAFCSQFIVTAALRLAAVEAQLADPPWIDAFRDPARGGRVQWAGLKTVPRSE